MTDSTQPLTFQASQHDAEQRDLVTRVHEVEAFAYVAGIVPPALCEVWERWFIDQRNREAPHS